MAGNITGSDASGRKNAPSEESADERLKRKPTDEELLNLSKCIVKEWSFLAIRLEVSRIDDIKIDYAKDVTQQAFQMLMRWRKEKDSSASVQSLCIALRKEHLNETIRKIFLINPESLS
eukprot:m.201256 g.201256  ORF g.201256 m.201256 type:complete len:119 (+) comp39596_c1_seq8:3324-3680(+)